MNYVLSKIGTVEKYEDITCRISTIMCVLSVLQKNQFKVHTSPFGSLHMTRNHSITTAINETQDTAHGQVTWQ